MLKACYTMMIEILDYYERITVEIEGVAMGFWEEYSSNIGKLRTEYDLAAFCYDYLIGIVGDQECFIGKYILSNKKAAIVNPNLEQLGHFSRQVERWLLKHDSDERHEALPFKHCMSGICESALKVIEHLEPYGEEELNVATVSLYILYAIDRYLGESQMQRSGRMPKNVFYQKNSYIYLAPKHNILDTAEEQLEFSHVIRPLLIRNQLKNIIILEQQEIKDKKPPEVVNLWISQQDEDRRNVLAGKKLKVVVIPFEKEKMVQFPSMESGILFRVKYTDWYKEHGKGHALKLLDLAIGQKANIVIFPEYVCEPSVQKAIGEHLRELYKRKPKFMKHLLLVVAGSGWTEDDNNVSCVYSYDGRILGRQYKTTKFNRKTEDGEGYLEGLSEPGRETTIFEVEGWGDIMLAICRDVSDPEALRTLAERFRPQFLLVPAWSSSIRNGFEQQLGDITAKNHRTCSVVCNCCEAFGTKEENRDKSGMIVTPVKEGSLVKGKVDFIPRGAECWKDGTCGGCVWMVELCFEPDKVRNQKVVGKMKQKKCK